MKEVKYYEAMDGTQFKTFDECQYYEMHADEDATIDVTICYRQTKYIPYKLTLPKTVISGWDNISQKDLFRIEEELSKLYGDGEILTIETNDMILENIII